MRILQRREELLQINDMKTNKCKCMQMHANECQHNPIQPNTTQNNSSQSIMEFFRNSEKFNFSVFEQLVRKEYAKLPDYQYTIDEVLQIFKYYFSSYKAYTGKEHPKLTAKQILKVIETLPYIEDEHQNSIEIPAEDYKTLIDGYFNTDMNCDRCILHFISGQIRTNRLYENLY